VSHAGIVSKRLNVGSRKEHNVMAQGLFSDAKIRWWTTPLSAWNLRWKWPIPFLTAQFRLIFAHSALVVRADEKSSISTNRKSTTRFPTTATSHRWTVYVIPKSPQWWHKNAILLFFPVGLHFNFCRIKSATKFFYVKTSSGKVVATSFLYLTVHRWIAGDVPNPHLPKICAQSDPPPSENADFDIFRLIVPQPWEREKCN